MNKNEIIIGLVIGLFIGTGIIYINTSSKIDLLSEQVAFLSDPQRITELESGIIECRADIELFATEIDELENEYDSVKGSVLNLVLLESDYSAFDAQYSQLEEDYEEVFSHLNILISTYNDLQEAAKKMDALYDINQTITEYLDANNFILVTESPLHLSVSIPAGEMRILGFVMPNGVIFEDEVCYSGDKVANWHSWKKVGVAGTVTGGGQNTAEGYTTLELEVTVRYSITGGYIDLTCNWDSNYSYVDSRAHTRLNLS